VSAATRTRKPVVDPTCAEAVDLARAAAEEVAPHEVGEHLGVSADADRVVTHYFDCRKPAYRGWRWAVTVTRAPRTKHVTVDETVLLPGEEAVLPPEWVPWSDRLRPGDLGVGDILPTAEDDDRLEPGFLGGGDEEYASVAYELGLGRPRVLSPAGRDDAVERWYSGEHGPTAPIAQAAPARCATCGFLLLLAGELRQLFGVCANEYSPSDGQVVSLDHGCGAHSEAAARTPASADAQPVVDEFDYEYLPPES
jgi:Protein of unknown function (DUF3027)